MKNLKIFSLICLINISGFLLAAASPLPVGTYIELFDMKSAAYNGKLGVINDKPASPERVGVTLLENNEDKSIKIKNIRVAKNAKEVFEKDVLNASLLEQQMGHLPGSSPAAHDESWQLTVPFIKATYLNRWFEKHPDRRFHENLSGDLERLIRHFPKKLAEQWVLETRKSPRNMIKIREISGELAMWETKVKIEIVKNPVICEFYLSYDDQEAAKRIQKVVKKELSRENWSPRYFLFTFKLLEFYAQNNKEPDIPSKLETPLAKFGELVDEYKNLSQKKPSDVVEVEDFLRSMDHSLNETEKVRDLKERLLPLMDLSLNEIEKIDEDGLSPHLILHYLSENLSTVIARPDMCNDSESNFSRKFYVDDVISPDDLFFTYQEIKTLKKKSSAANAKHNSRFLEAEEYCLKLKSHWDTALTLYDVYSLLITQDKITDCLKNLESLRKPFSTACTKKPHKKPTLSASSTAGAAGIKKTEKASCARGSSMVKLSRQLEDDSPSLMGGGSSKPLRVVRATHEADVDDVVQSPFYSHIYHEVFCNESKVILTFDNQDNYRSFQRCANDQWDRGTFRCREECAAYHASQHGVIPFACTPLAYLESANTVVKNLLDTGSLESFSQKITVHFRNPKREVLVTIVPKVGKLYQDRNTKRLLSYIPFLNPSHP